MIIVGLFAALLVAFFFAACNVAHRADEYAKQDENAIKQRGEGDIK